MNIHEYQAKSVLAKYGVAVPAGKVAFTVEEAIEAAKELGGKKGSSRPRFTLVAAARPVASSWPSRSTKWNSMQKNCSVKR